MRACALSPGSSHSAPTSCSHYPWPPAYTPNLPRCCCFVPRCCTQAAATVIMYIQSGLVTADLVHHPEDLWKFGSVCPALKHPLKQLGQTLLARLQ